MGKLYLEKETGATVWDPNGVNVGDKVKYSRKFCQSIGALAGWLPHVRGRIEALEPFGAGQLATIHWEPCEGRPATKGKVLVSNLWRADRLHLEPV
jgi:hypothetical protein